MHYAKVLLDALFGRECFLNEIIWAYDYGAKSEEPLAGQARHDPGLREEPEPVLLRLGRRRSRAVHGARAGHAGEGRARQAADRCLVAHHRLAHRQGEDRLPDAEAARASCAGSCRPPAAPGDSVLDFFAGSGTTGAVAAELGRRFLLVDESAEAIAVIRKRLAGLIGRRGVQPGSAGRMNRRPQPSPAGWTHARAQEILPRLTGE